MVRLTLSEKRLSKFYVFGSNDSNGDNKVECGYRENKVESSHKITCKSPMMSRYVDTLQLFMKIPKCFQCNSILEYLHLNVLCCIFVSKMLEKNVKKFTHILKITVHIVFLNLFHDGVTCHNEIVFKGSIKYLFQICMDREKIWKK